MCDMFGYRIALNFNKRGDTHVTLCGGITTIIMGIILFLYITYKLKGMLDYSDDKTNIEIQSFDVDNEAEKSFKNSNIFIFHTIRK